MSEKDELRDHSFDGIQEYDNDLPRWWVWLFAITVIASVIYPFLYDFRSGSFASETIESEMASLRQAKPQEVAQVTEQDLIQLTTDSSALSQGQQIFTTRCLACHGDKGQGVIGPNLTDEYWIHGGKITDIHKIVTNGVLEKGMLPWKDQLSPEQIRDVVAFVWTLYGTNPANPKAPQGDKFERK